MTRATVTPRLCVVGDGGLEEGDGALLPLVGQDLREGEARGVVDADVDELPADAAGLALACAVAGDAMADALEAAELLDVDVDQLAGMLALVAADRLGRLQRRDAVEAEALEDAADGGRRDADLGGDLLAGPALAAQGFDLLDDRRRRRPVQAMRPRRAILQALRRPRP